METNQTEKRKGGYLGLVVALVFAIGIAMYFVISEYRTNTDLTAQQNELQTKFKNLSDTLDTKTAVINQFVTKDAELVKTISGDETIITQEKKNISELLSKNKMTKGELAKAKDMIAQYVASIDDLQKKVGELTDQNQQLAQANQLLTNNLTSEEQTATQLTEQNKGLSKKVEVGSLLEIPKIKVEGVKVKGNGKEVAVRKAKAAQSLKIEFETGSNKVLDTGEVSLFVRVINPKGETLNVQDQGGGSLQLQDGKGMVEYTKKADFDWDKANKKVTVYCNSDVNTPGKYKVELYQTGYLIASSDVDLK